MIRHYLEKCMEQEIKNFVKGGYIFRLQPSMEGSSVIAHIFFEQCNLHITINISDLTNKILCDLARGNFNEKQWKSIGKTQAQILIRDSIRRCVDNTLFNRS